MATGTERFDPADPSAWVTESAEELRVFLVGVLRNADLAGEALQATLAKAVEQGHTARPESRKGWLYRVALNEALVIKRRGKTQERTFRELARIDPRRHESPSGSATRDESPDGILLQTELIQQVRLALDDLPAEQRHVVRMRIYEQKTFAVIAKELGVPLGTVLTRMRLAMQKLRQILEHFEM